MLCDFSELPNLSEIKTFNDGFVSISLHEVDCLWVAKGDHLRGMG